MTDLKDMKELSTSDWAAGGTDVGRYGVAAVHQIEELKAQLATARNDALDEASKTAYAAAVSFVATYAGGQHASTIGSGIAAEIRALKTEPTNGSDE
jgi:hypothetical protein